MISAFGVEHIMAKSLPSALKLGGSLRLKAKSKYARDLLYANQMGKQMRPRFAERNKVTDIGPRMHMASAVKQRAKKALP
jgi:hypothetical protein